MMLLALSDEQVAHGSRLVPQADLGIVPCPVLEIAERLHMTEADASAIKTLPEFNSGDLSMIQRSRLELMDA